MKLAISLLAVVSLIVTGVPALQVSAQDISNTPTSYPFGAISAGEIKDTGLDYFTVTNDSAVSVNITISGTNMTGGVDWVLSDDATSGNNTYGLIAGLESESYNITVRRTGPFNTLVSGLAESGNQSWGLQLLAPTSFSDGEVKTGTVTLTATQG